MFVAAYCRVSTEKEDQANSFQAQQRYFRACIERHPDWQLYDIYADEGISGTYIRKRLRFLQMLEDAEAGKFQLILTKEVSRFSRNLLDTIDCTRRLKKLGVGVCFLQDGINTLDGDGELRLSIMASIAQEESRKTSQRVKWGQQRRMEQGVVFGHSLLGYTLRGGILQPEAKGAALVRRIYHCCGVLQQSAAQIARDLNREGLRSPSGGMWSGGSVLKVLKNEKYAGDLVQKKSYTPDYLSHEKKPNRGAEALIVLRDHHEALVSRSLWDAAQAQLARRSRKQGNRGSGSSYPLSGKLFCGLCGGALVARRRKSADGSVTLRWGCGTAAARGRAGCSLGCLLPDREARYMLLTALAAVEGLREEAERAVNEQLRRAEEARQQKSEAEAERLLRRRAQLQDACLAGELNPEELGQLLQRCDRKLQELRESMVQRREAAALPPLPPEEALEDALCRLLTERITLFREGAAELRLPGVAKPFLFRRIGEKNQGNID